MTMHAVSTNFSRRWNHLSEAKPTSSAPTTLPAMLKKPSHSDSVLPASLCKMIGIDEAKALKIPELMPAAKVI